jgi:hypothetical protein
MTSESARLGDLNLPEHFRWFQSGAAERNAEILARFLGVSLVRAHEIVATDHLFAD